MRVMDESRPLIALEDVDVTLAGRRVLRAVSWRLQETEHWAILGANGAGKSTLLRVIAGEQWPDPGSGTRTYCFSSDPPDAVRAAKSYIAQVSPEAQERHVRMRFELTGREFVESGLFDGDYVYDQLTGPQKKRVDAIFERFDLERLGQQRTAALSQGELRRLLIARALVREPRVLLLDEWSSGLDARARADVLALLERISERTQLIIASHRVDDFPACVSKRAHLHDGRLALADEREPAERRVHDRVARAEGEIPYGEPIVRIESADVFIETQHVLYGITWEIRRGQHWAIEGPNGAGKSTLAKLIAGSLTAVRGAYIERFGSDAHVSLWELKRRIVLLSDELQTQYDQPLAAEGVVASGFFSSIGLMRAPNSAQRERADHLLHALDLERLRGRDFLRLSFGERRKVLIARALVGAPEIVIVDEIFNGLDAQFRGRLFGLLDELAQAGATCIVIAHHDEDVPAFITRRLMLEGGRVVGQR